MSLLQWAGYKGLADYTVDEVTPYALPIIVRLEKNSELIPSHEETQLAVAKAIIAFFDSAKTCAGGEWHEAVKAWLSGRIRKVARRARGTEWEAVKALDGIYAKYGKAEVIILPPHLADAPPAEVKKLQVSGLDLVRDQSFVSPASKGVLQVAVNPEIPMTTGKTLAQVGHAVQLAIFASTWDVMNSWRSNATPVSIVDWDSLDTDAVDVHDAGFTEVESGSLTAKSFLHY